MLSYVYCLNQQVNSFISDETAVSKITLSFRRCLVLKQNKLEIRVTAYTPHYILLLNNEQMEVLGRSSERFRRHTNLKKRTVPTKLSCFVYFSPTIGWKFKTRKGGRTCRSYENHKPMLNANVDIPNVVLIHWSS